MTTELAAGPITERLLFDADSHVMEPSDWLREYADASIRDRLRPAFEFAELDRDRAAQILEGRRSTPDRRSKAESRTWGQGFRAYGAFGPAERVEVLDRFNIGAQLVFHTFAPAQFVGSDHDLLYGGVRALTRALVEFCSIDPRLLAVPYVPFSDPERAAGEIDFAIEGGCGGILLDQTAPSADMGPGHAEIDPLWARLAEADLPFVLHIGTGGRLVPEGLRHNGRTLPPDFLGGGENLRSKDYMGISHWPEMYLAVLALDGVFERHPNLRGASIEQGAEWLPGLLRRLDGALNFARTEPDLAALPLKPSEYLRRQIKVTPFPKEDTAWVLSDVGDRMLMFSSDYPHVEGTRDPIGRFTKALEGFDEATRERFFVTNMAELLGSHAPPIG